VPIEKDGTLGPRADLASLTGEPGPDGKRQASSHPHDAVFDPSGRFLAVPDLGFDRIFVFRLDGEYRTVPSRVIPAITGIFPFTDLIKLSMTAVCSSGLEICDHAFDRRAFGHTQCGQ
jgi:hypothetical protein